MNENILNALQIFSLDMHHETIHDNVNDLIGAGFPANFLLPLISVFQSGQGYQYQLRGKAVHEMIGIGHLSLIHAIADHVGVPPDTGSEFTGRGFAMREIIDAIRQIVGEQARKI